MKQSEYAPIVSGREMMSLVETGESRTPRPAGLNLHDDIYLQLHKIYTNRFRQNDELPSQYESFKLLPELLDQLVALGQLAQKLIITLRSNGHRLEKIKQLMKDE